NNCIYMLGASVSQPTQLVSTALVGNAFCYGQNGTIDLSTSGGIAPYTYNWSNTAQDTLISAPAGNYSVTVTDANNCQIVLNETIGEPTELTATTTVVPIACFGDLADVTINATGGTGNYTYAWSA